MWCKRTHRTCLTHALSVLQSPRVFRETIQCGKVRNNAEKCSICLTAVGLLSSLVTGTTAGEKVYGHLKT